MSCKAISNLQDWDQSCSAAAGQGVVAVFWASWSEPSVQLRDIVTELASDFAASVFVSVEAESVADVADRFDISMVPTVLFVAADGTTVTDRVDGFLPLEVRTKVTAAAASKTTVAPSTSLAAPPAKAAVAPAPAQGKLEDRLYALIHSAPVMLFMKGSPSSPSCGFSRKIVALLQSANIQFSSFDILSDNDVRQGLKTYSNWPTFPQLYIGGALVGGLDIVKEMHEEGELKTMIDKALVEASASAAPAAAAAPSATAASADTVEPGLAARLDQLINSAPVMLFMKGSPSKPECGFSRKMVALLQQHNITFASFNILSDNDVRQGLKIHSKWPTYPQLYAKGQLLGGLDIVTQMIEDGEFKSMISESA